MVQPSLNAITLLTADMAASVRFYATLGMGCVFGGPDAAFSTMDCGGGTFINLQFDSMWSAPRHRWGRFIVWVADVDAAHLRLIDAGYQPLMAPADAVWGERYFHILDPAGHEVSIARPLSDD